jgi:type IV secretory pathway TraG/TraD family ATPase VirD4
VTSSSLNHILSSLYAESMNKTNTDSDRITYFAVTNYRDIRKLFGIKEKNRRAHIYIIGKTGTGKSTLIENMVVSDIQDGNGVALIDPHGDLAEKILTLIPRERINDVIYFNPADIDYPIAFNPLEKIHPDFHDIVASGLIAVFKKIWSDFWGPRLEHILRYSIMTLLEYPGSTLLDIPRLLTDGDFRKSVLLKVNHPQVKAFWASEYDKYSAWMRSTAISPILNKIGQFLVSIPLRNIVGQRHNTFKLRTVMDEKKILIVNLAKGRIGEDNCALMGAMLVTRMQLAAMSRANLPESRRHSYYLYVDEMHNFITLSFADVLSEARKYGLSLTLAHQYIEQLDSEIRAAVFGNVGTMIVFRLGAKDARYLAREFSPVFSEHDIINLGNYRIFLKLMIDGVTSKAFSADTLPGPEKQDSYADVIVDLSRIKYARPRKDVEREISTS